LAGGGIPTVLGGGTMIAMVRDMLDVTPPTSVVNVQSYIKVYDTMITSNARPTPARVLTWFGCNAAGPKSRYCSNLRLPRHK
jgi:hypothetical protein